MIRRGSPYASLGTGDRMRMIAQALAPSANLVARYDLLSGGRGYSCSRGPSEGVAAVDDPPAQVTRFPLQAR